MKRKGRPDPVDIYVGSQIKIHRRALGMSQGDLAACLGVTFQQIQKYENGSNRVGSGRLQHIATVLNVPVSTFFVGVEHAGRKRTDYLVEISNTGDGLELVKAFMRLDNKQLRRSIVELVKTLAKTPGARREI